LLIYKGSGIGTEGRLITALLFEINMLIALVKERINKKIAPKAGTLLLFETPVKGETFSLN
jgi:hypothetical protein